MTVFCNLAPFVYCHILNKMSVQVKVRFGSVYLIESVSLILEVLQSSPDCH